MSKNSRLSRRLAALTVALASVAPLPDAVPLPAPLGAARAADAPANPCAPRPKKKKPANPCAAAARPASATRIA